MSWPVILETERLVLRPWRETDAEALFEWSRDPEVGPRAGWAPHESLDESRQVLAEILMAEESFAIVIKDREPADEPVGCISLEAGEKSELGLGVDEAELGYWIGRPFWNAGYMTEAVREIMRRAFCDLGLSAIWAGYFAQNPASGRVQEKAGMRRDRRIKGRPRPKLGDSADEIVTKLTREAWEVAQIADPSDAATVARQGDEASLIISALPRLAAVRSGGQTGADRAALDAARAMGVAIEGWCPRGGLAEDMPEPPGLLASYPELVEGPSDDYVERTAWNVRDSHATLIVAPAGIETGSGTEMTVRFAEAYGRPHLEVADADDVEEVALWIAGLPRGLTLNVAGPRESKCPGTYAATYALMTEILSRDAS